MYVLEDSLETKKRGKPVYLECITGIGPAYTESEDKAEKFYSRLLAMQSKAYSHPMCFFEPKLV
jgi:hypothetical protein